jgi:hypothetical protein
MLLTLATPHFPEVELLANAIALFRLRKPQLMTQLTNYLPTLANLLVLHDSSSKL